ncbi:brain-specific angiogenesis inhibitor 1-associated protein 2-like protein 2 [Chelmon rostratus]|uniref:brain-specific angiogenesis inhibitor 1-associated protein 2-like protein 2 n=1 Tax=Chelmon rostratus TaxID=109905 RepID=UPI001BE9E06F|nr:brain-specific angiogenesis inhibitor 1-associated protein 2-like protein 2 [Chelmon rostratus]
MSGMNSDQLHRSTLEIYSSVMEEFNPSLQKLVSLGNSYIQAFQALAATSEAYFSALSKIGERAFHTKSSHSIGDVLIQISESQRKLTLELEGVFRWFRLEVIQELENNVRLDRQYISDSRRHYEMEVHNQAAALERQLRRGVNLDYSEHVEFLRKSHSEALREEERRHRFLAEKHCGLIQSIANLMNKTGGSLQQRADAWEDELNATRGPAPRRFTSLDNSVGVREEEIIRRSREEVTLGQIPSRAPSPQGSVYHSRTESVGGGGGGRSMRALADHQPSASNPTLLPFSRGEMITVRVQQPKNGWLYGRADGGSRQGWFPASYVEPVDEPLFSTNNSRRPSLRSSSSMNNLLESGGGGYNAPLPPPPPPPPPSSNRQSEVPAATMTLDRRPELKSENKRSNPNNSRPELFPRGTNPFATVKLRPTHTDDRSSPRFNRQ